MCSNLLVAFYWAPCFCMYRLALRRKSMSVDSQHQYIVFLQQFLKGGFYTGKNRTPHTQDTARRGKRRFLHLRKGKFFLYTPALCILSQFRCRCFPFWEQREVSTSEKPEIFKHRSLSPIHSPLWVHVCTVIIKREVSTPEKISYRNLHPYLHGKTLPLSQNRDFHTRN